MVAGDRKSVPGAVMVLVFAYSYRHQRSVLLSFLRPASIPRISVCRYGLFSYVICEPGPVVEKRFWFSTKIEKIMDWFLSKYTYNISE